MGNMSMDYSRLRERMREMNITQKELAARIPASESHFCKKMSGEYPFTQDEILKICDILKIPADKVSYYFFTVKVEKPQPKGGQQTA